MISSVNELNCNYVQDSVGEWNLSSLSTPFDIYLQGPAEYVAAAAGAAAPLQAIARLDNFKPCKLRSGVGGKPDLIAHNWNWCGVMRVSPGISLQRMYYRWIHNYRHGRNW
jgi:hypothetical protein